MQQHGGSSLPPEQRWLEGARCSAAAQCASMRHNIMLHVHKSLQPQVMLTVNSGAFAGVPCVPNLQYARAGSVLGTRAEVTLYYLAHRKAAVRLRLAFPNWKLGVGRVVPPASHARTTPFLPALASRSLSTKSGLGSI